MNTYNRILKTLKKQKGIFAFLIDPEKTDANKIEEIILNAANNGVDLFFVGGSTVTNQIFEKCISKIKKSTKKPVIIFPGSVEQISTNCDALLFLSLISGRNPLHLIEQQVKAAPILRKIGIEAISTAYILIDGKVETTVQKISGTEPLPSNEIDLIVAHAIASEYLGFKFIYLEAGSGAKKSISNKIIKKVSENCTLPIIVGGGIKSAIEAKEKIKSGANIIVTGNFFENKNSRNKIRSFANAIHN